MNQDTPSYRNLWSLTVLCLLRTGPIHPYEMQRRIREWHKDEFLDLKRGSLYSAIDRLSRAGLIAPVKVTREGRRPERTVYRLTQQGENETTVWLRELLAKPVREPGQFFAALSFLAVLPPTVALLQLKERIGVLEEHIKGLGGVLKTMTPRIGRLPLIEVEYERAMKRAELIWVKSLIEDLRTGALSWDPEAIRKYIAGIADQSYQSHQSQLPCRK